MTPALWVLLGIFIGFILVFLWTWFIVHREHKQYSITNRDRIQNNNNA